MNEARKPEDAPGHYGAGYGEQVPADAPPRPAPNTDADATATAPTPAVEAEPSTAATAGITAQGDDGAPVVFTPDDVGARPPDHPPTENAPESEKAGLIFERS